MFYFVFAPCRRLASMSMVYFKNKKNSAIFFCVLSSQLLFIVELNYNSFVILLLVIKWTSTMSDPADQNEPPKDPKELEKMEEAKLKAKFPNAVLGRGPGGHSAFLQKRLAKGQKFFDSGDYQMAKQRPSNLAAPFKTPAAPAKQPTGDAIPTPETVPIRKTSIIQPKFHPSTQTS